MMKHILNIFTIFLIVSIALSKQQDLSESTDEYIFYPLIDSLTHKIYLLRNNQCTLFLVASCRQGNLLSISLNQSASFTEAPRYDIYGDHHSQNRRLIPFEQCGVIFSRTKDNLISIRRKDVSHVFFTIENIRIIQGHHRIVIRDLSTKWGLGQRFQEHFHLTDGHWTIWNRDRPWQIDSGKHFQSSQTYGHQPLYLAREHFSNLYHLVYFKNTHGLMIQSEEQSQQLVYNSVGGNIHFLIFIGREDPQKVLSSYHQFIGRAHIPPFWSMGYHQSRWGYRSLEQVQAVINLFDEYQVPLDAFWLDLDYMRDKKIFSVDEISYPPEDLKALMKEYKIRLVPLLDVGVATKDKQLVKKGKDMRVFLRSPLTSEYYYKGEVWPGEVYYVDYLHPNASLFWKEQLENLYSTIQFSGVWLDMNQPTNFKGGQQVFQPFPVQKIENINTMTINVDIPHFSTDNNDLNHSEVHAYYGHLSTIPTFQYLQQKGRPFILTRSNSVGTGVFAAHWTGDNVANWEFLRSSINSNFLFQIFGIQMVGSDICGFYMNSNQDLCSRWMQLGSFYPFARNHNHQSAIPQQPYEFGPDHLLTSMYSLSTRYALLKQLYTWLVMKKGKGSFFRPLGFQFYQDQASFGEYVSETQFLIGKSLMVAPILQPLAQSRAVYFPGEQSDLWYQFKVNIDLGSVDSSTIKERTHSWYYYVENILPSPPLTFLRNGFLLLTNYPETRSSKLSNIFFIFCAMKDNHCMGEILGLNDYQNQQQLEMCIRDDCLVNFLISKETQDQLKFRLEWSYKGFEPKYSLSIKEIIITQKGMIWKIQQQIDIKGREGSIELASCLKLL